MNLIQSNTIDGGSGYEFDNSYEYPHIRFLVEGILSILSSHHLILETSGNFPKVTVQPTSF